MGRRILWNMSEFPDIREGESFVFRIAVDRPGTPWYYWVGGGAVAGGIVTYFVLKNKPGGTDDHHVIVVPNPLPPGR
jgi:FtsP/CotA-like multicopper oxidase with cupredoxin domain